MKANHAPLATLVLAWIACQKTVSPDARVPTVSVTSDLGAVRNDTPQTTTTEVFRDRTRLSEVITTLLSHNCCGPITTETTSEQVGLRKLTTTKRVSNPGRTKGTESSIASHEIDEKARTENGRATVEPCDYKDRANVDTTDIYPVENATEDLTHDEVREISDESGEELWSITLDRFQLALTCIGYVANMVTFITLVRNGRMFSPAICLLLKHQALIDSWASAMGTILLLQPPLWKTGNYNFNQAVCYLWHSQGAYWATIYMSVWNLVAIAVERYIAVCHPFKHSNFQGTPVRVIIASMYVASIILLFPSYIQVRFEDGNCISEFLIHGKLGRDLFYGYSIVCLFSLYLLPALAFVFLYGRIIASLRHRRKSSHSGTSKALKTVQAAVTKTALVVTAVFMVTIGFDAWSYTLGYTGVTSYEFGTPVQKIGVFFAVCNSVINPFVYLVFMPPFRNSLVMTICCRPKPDESANNSATMTQNTEGNCV